MDEMMISATIGALMRIKSMIFDDPTQPIKNCRHIVDAILKEIDKQDIGLPMNLEDE